VPEIVEDGVTGFIVETEAEAVNAISKLASLDRTTVRQAFEQRFTARRMAADYLKCFETLLSGQAQKLIHEHHSASSSGR
jgi:glycosyltransferase involved in cell wall biosynthesis